MAYECDITASQPAEVRSAEDMPAVKPGLLSHAYRDLAPIADQLASLDAALAHLTEAGDAAAEEDARALRRELRRVEPSVTMIGQVKAGKTSLVNAMIGRPGLLPADINPWTSVVTSIHLSPGIREGGEQAKFRFFSEEEWATLLQKGGRVGELARRAGADQELEKVRAQLEKMRATSKRRLGDKFEMLLGQEHAYGYVDPELVERYVCLGDETEDDGVEASQGRFADVTRSADLFLRQTDLAMPLCIRDTPGVNDTFMVREQITVNAIRASRLCVVVLSAHQALSTVDMALIRLIANIPSRQVIIFVNRVDELEDPARDIPEIHASIQATLKAQNGPVDAEIIFGSALWAMTGLQGNLERMNRASADTLVKMAEHEVRQGLEETSVEAMVWALSGLPALGAAIARRIGEGDGADAVNRLSVRARNIGHGLSVTSRVAARQVGDQALRPVDQAKVLAEYDAFAARAEAALSQQMETLNAALEDRLTSARQTFLGRATTGLISHLETYGENEVWTYDPAGLRLLLRTGYQVFASKAARAAEAAFDDAARRIKGQMVETFRLPEACFDLDPPQVVAPPPPVILGQTIALDIKGAWWSRWWRRRRSYDAYADEFSALIEAELLPMAQALVTDHAEPYRQTVLNDLRAFLAGQRERLHTMAGLTETDRAQMTENLAIEDERRRRNVGKALSLLARVAPEDMRSAAE
ncbi:dynamin family protein [Gymnodinialimonas sp. 2305UL16-5]|uniref:dynamin family protein n=1 Tax=Gymnodinialimonas mytili TaxID=3126503 RepID=UPI0030B71DA4